jgi:hypothetical protein
VTVHPTPQAPTPRAERLTAAEYAAELPDVLGSVESLTEMLEGCYVEATALNHYALKAHAEAHGHNEAEQPYRKAVLAGLREMIAYLQTTDPAAAVAAEIILVDAERWALHDDRQAEACAQAHAHDRAEHPLLLVGNGQLDAIVTRIEWLYSPSIRRSGPRCRPCWAKRRPCTDGPTGGAA